MKRPTNSRVEGTPRTTIPEPRRRSEAGDTLIEVLMALIVLGIASVALIIAFGTSISASADHRQLSATGIVLDAVSQEAISEIQANPTLFTCPMPVPNYESQVTLNVPSPYTSQYTAQFATGSPVQYWNPNASPAPKFDTPCVAGEPQLIAVTVTQDSTNQPFTNRFVVDSPLDSVSSQVSGGGSAGPAAQLVFTTEPVGGVTGEQLATQPVVTVEDAQGNVVTNDLSPVLLSITGGGANLTGCAGTESLGVVTFTGCTVSASGSFTLTAVDEDFTSSLPFTSASFTVSPATDYLKFTTQPVGGMSGTTLSTQPVVTVNNSGGVDKSWTGTITLTSSGGVLSNCPGIPVVQGVATFSGCKFAGAYFYNPISKVYLATPYTLTASATNSVPTSPATSQTFAVSGPGGANQLIFTTQPTGVGSSSPNSAFVVQPVVTIEDAYGNIVTTSTASITLSISSGTLTCTSNPVNASSGSGVATFSGCAGSAYSNGITLTAMSTGLASATSASFNITEPASQLVFTTQPVAGVSGSAFTTQPVLLVEDPLGSIVTSSTTPITLTPSGGTLSLCTNLTPNGGIVQVATCNFVGKVLTSYTLTATQGSGSGALTTTSGYFSPSGPGTPTQLVFTTQPVAGPAGWAFTTQPVVSIEDSGGNVTTSAATIALTSSGGTLAACSNLTAVVGVVNVANCTFGGLVAPATYTMTAASSSLVSATSGSFTPSGPGPASASNSSVIASATSVSSNGTSNSTITVSLVDAYGNRVPGASVTLNQAGGSSAVTVNPTTTNSAGVAVFTVTDTTPQSVTYTAVDTTDSVTVNQAAVVTFFGSPSQISLAGCTSSITAGSVCSATATIEDANGNVVSNFNGAVAFNQINSGGSVIGLTNVTSFTNGLATVSLTGNKAGTVAIDAAGDGFTSNSITFNVTSGVATTIAVTSGSGQSATVGTAFANPLVATVTDAYGNPESGTVVTFTVPGSGATATFAGNVNTATTNASGVATSVVVTAGHTVGTYNISASATGTNTVNFSEINTVGAATTIAVTSGSGQSAKVGVAFTNPLVAKVTDTYGNPVSGAVVTFTAPGSGATATFAGNVYTATTNASGLATSVALTAGTVSGTFNITASAPGTNTVNFSETNSVGSPATAVFSTQPSNVAAGAPTSAGVTITDTYGNPVASSTVTISKYSGTGAISGTLTASTNASGVASFSNIIFTAAGSYQLTATDGAATVNSSSYTVSAAAPATAVFSTQPSNVAAGAPTSAGVTITDTYGNPVASSTVTISKYSGTGAISGTLTASTNASGVASFSNIIFTAAGSYQLTATDGAATVNSSSYTVNPGTATKFSVSAPSTATAGTAFTVTVTAQDQYGNTATGYRGTAKFTNTDAGTGWVLPGNYTFTATDNGVHVFTNGFTLVTAGTQTVTATDTVTSSITGTSASITVSPGTATKFLVSAPGTTTAGTAFTVTVTAVDQYNNVATGYRGTATFSKSDSKTGSAVPGNYTFTATDNGVHTFTNGFTLVTAGSQTVTATDTVTSSITGTSASITVSAAAPATAVFSTQPSNTPTGGNTTAGVTITDTYGNPVASSTVVLSRGSGFGTLSATSGLFVVTNASGVANFTGVHFSILGSHTLTATDGSATVTSVSYTQN